MHRAARTRAVFFAAISLVAGGAAAACGLDVTGTLDGVGDGGGEGARIDGATPPGAGADAGDAGDAGGDGASAGGDGEAGPPCPPDMVDTGSLGALGSLAAGFCVDRLEVTQEAYAKFLASAAGLDASMPGACSFKKSHDPSDAGDIAQDCQFDPAAHGGRPVVCADWCDAKAYCEWAGKRLCGRIGGGPVPPNAQQDAGSDEWYFACSRGGTRVYPYGDTFDGNKCMDDGVGPPDDAGSRPQCAGGFDGLYDMSGNVLEWEDSCTADGGAGDLCRARGGSYAYTIDTELRCDAIPNGALGFDQKRSARFDDTGLRCCADRR